MLQQIATEWTVPTPGRGFIDLTARLAEWVGGTSVTTGLLTLHLRHTSASLIIQENADPEVRADLERFFLRLTPDGDALFEHAAEGPDDMPAHIRTALTAVNLSIPVLGRALTLGTWQGVYLWEHRLRPQRRRLVLHLLGE